uniref:Uncharacterized protein n=1 Tax=Arundo donax TaxID=35708 RepID=A0A0A8Y6W8_ARUDO
MNVLLLCMM